MSDYDERRKETADAMLALVALEPVTNAVLVQTVGPERKIVISIMLKDEAERENMEKLARIVEQLIIHPSQPFVHPAFPYENPRTPAAIDPEAIERAAEALHIERNRQWEAIRPGTRNPLIAVTWAEENEPFKERLRQEVQIVLAAVANASTEAMLTHMADVHLTPTAEKGK